MVSEWTDSRKWDGRKKSRERERDGKRVDREWHGKRVGREQFILRWDGKRGNRNQ